MTVAAISQQATIATSPDDWTASVPFDQFNPAAGTLLDAMLTLTGNVDASAAIENLAPAAATVALGVTGSISASSTTFGALGSVAPTAMAAVNLGAFQGTFDGSVNFSGPSAEVLTGIAASQTVTTQVAPSGGGTAAGPIEGTGTFDVGVTSSADSTVEANGNFAILLNASAGAVLSLQYQDSATAGGYSPYGSDAGSGFQAASPGFFLKAGFDNTVTTTPQVVTFASETSGWTNTAFFTRFNPALGTLDEVVVTVSNSMSGTFSADNLGAAATWIGIDETASLTAGVPTVAGGLTATSTTDTTLNLGAYDGSEDFTGASGGTTTFAGASGWNDETDLTSAMSLTAFTGTGTVSVPVSTTGSSILTGPGNLYAISTQQTGGTISVSYVYTPAVTTASQPAAQIKGGSLFGMSGQEGLAPFALAAQITPKSLATAPMTFVGPAAGDLTAQPDETFALTAGASAAIANFSPSAGDKLNLTGLLTGASLAANLSNIGQFVTVTTGSGYTELSINGPLGSASLSLTGTSPVALLDLLGNNALIVPR